MGFQFCLWLCIICLAFLQTYSRPNVLIIIADDLSPVVDPYISQDHPMHGKTPNLKSLVDRGDTFLQASVQQSVCGPSRASFLSGRFPGSTQIFNFEKYLFEVSEELLSIPKYFKSKLGYYTAAFGKIFHPPRNGENGDPYFDHGHFSQPTKAYSSTGNQDCGNNNKVYCVVNENLKNEMTDAKIVRQFVKFLDSRNNKQTPWLALVGFRRVG